MGEECIWLAPAKSATLAFDASGDCGSVTRRLATASTARLATFKMDRRRKLPKRIKEFSVLEAKTTARSIAEEAPKFASSDDATSAETEPASYLVLRDRVLRLGIDSWDDSSATWRVDASHGDDAQNHVLLKEWLRG